MSIRTIQQTFANRHVWEPLYRLQLRAEAFEAELFQSAPLRRLKHLHHYGAGALISPVIHSRFEHTVGVWALVSTFFPDDLELRAAAIVHDVGHLPFSHTVEAAFGRSHHHRTEELISSPMIADILHKHGLSFRSIIRLLNEDSPLTHRTNGLGIDHLDSFLRDTYAAGCCPEPPSGLIRRIRFDGHQVETDEETALQLLHAVVNDNLIFLSPPFLAADALLSKAVLAYAEEKPELGVRIPDMADYELLALMQTSGSPDVQELLHVLLYAPHRIAVSYEADALPDGAVKTEVRKIYHKEPFVNGQPLSSLSAEAREKLQELEAARGTYYCCILPA